MKILSLTKFRFVKPGVVCFYNFTIISLIEISNEIQLEWVLWSSKHYATSWWKRCAADVLCRKLLVGQHPWVPHQDVTLGSGHGVKSGLLSCLDTVSLSAICVYPFVLSEVKITFTSHCLLATWAATWQITTCISEKVLTHVRVLVSSQSGSYSICSRNNCQNSPPQTLKRFLDALAQ